MYDAEELVLSLSENFTLLEMTRRFWEQACCFSTTCDLTLQNTLLHPELNRKCQWNSSILLICHQIILSMTMRKTGNTGQWKDARCWHYNQTIATFLHKWSKGANNYTEGQLRRRVIIKCQFRAWMTSEVTEDWLAVVWNRQPGVHLKNWVCWCWMPLRDIWHQK